MTVQEAIAEIKNMLIVAEHDCDGLNQEYENRTLEALIYAYEALQKQVPMKPKYAKNYIYEEAKCPSYDMEFDDIGGISESYGEIEKNNFCKYCGQRILWED